MSLVWTYERTELLHSLWIQEVQIKDVLVLLNRLPAPKDVPTIKAIFRKAESLKLPHRPRACRSMQPKYINEFSEKEKKVIDTKDHVEDYLIAKIFRKQERIKRLILQNKDKLEIATENSVPLREVYRLAAELRQQR